MNFQLTVNYKFIQAMKSGDSYPCDFIDKIIAPAYQNVGVLSGDWIPGWAKNISVGNHGNYLPEKAKDSWYYYAVQKSDTLVQK